MSIGKSHFIEGLNCTTELVQVEWKFLITFCIKLISNLSRSVIRESLKVFVIRASVFEGLSLHPSFVENLSLRAVLFRFRYFSLERLVVGFRAWSIYGHIINMILTIYFHFWIDKFLVLFIFTTSSGSLNINNETCRTYRFRNENIWWKRLNNQWYKLTMFTIFRVDWIYGEKTSARIPIGIWDFSTNTHSDFYNRVK